MRAFLMRYERSHLWMNRFVHLSSYIGCAVLVCPFARILGYFTNSIVVTLDALPCFELLVVCVLSFHFCVCGPPVFGLLFILAP